MYCNTLLKEDEKGQTNKYSLQSCNVFANCSEWHFCGLEQYIRVRITLPL